MDTSDIRESHILIKSQNFNEETAKFRLVFKVVFGKNEYEECKKKIDELGIEPSDSVLVVTHEFNNEEAASAAVEKIAQTYENVKPQMGPYAQSLEAPKVQGKTIIVPLRMPEQFQDSLSMAGPIIESLGDIALKAQKIEFSILAQSEIKSMFNNETATPAAAFFSGSCIKLSLSLHKDLFIKIAEIASQMGVGKKPGDIIEAGQILASLNHVHFEVELASPEGDTKQMFKDEMLMGTMMGAQMACGMAEQFGLMELTKNGGAQTTARFCINPAISFEFSMFAPTMMEALQKAANPA